MDLKEQFEEASVRSKSLPEQNNENLLKLYSLFKQATEGDVNIEKPVNMFDFKGIAKYNAWEELKGLHKEVAMQQYIDLVKSLGA
ncbi:MAG TPA: acyl-CoA-binding protein [Cytophagaceae bacterium]|jgi:diazepam-binding inhibitor (GABA receptor modulating acyl-CoA-binding protein)|nr:acyl-CoA-binding protein [Cytophagaceae bacterium]